MKLIKAYAGHWYHDSELAGNFRVERDDELLRGNLWRLYLDDIVIDDFATLGAARHRIVDIRLDKMDAALSDLRGPTKEE